MGLWEYFFKRNSSSQDDMRNAIIISQYDQEDHIVRQKLAKDEEIAFERAKELSLKEEDEKRNLQESKKKGKRNNAKDFPHSICNGCKLEIGGDRTKSINARGGIWHPQCLCCLHCHKLVSMDESYKLKGEFHKTCYKQQNRPNCYVCEKKIPRIYHEHPFWREKYCPSHDIDRTAKCCSCERLESCGTKYVMLEDGRWLCIECMECAVMNNDESVSLHIEIRDFFDTLSMKIEKEFHLLLVEKEALNEAEKKENIDNHNEINIIRGICLSEEQTVTSVIKGPRMGSNMQLIKGIVTKTQRVFRTRTCEVTAVLILYGLPRILTGSILAHELMHAWLRLNGYKDLDLVLEEGLCQVLSHMWLETQRFTNLDAIAAANPSLASSSSTPLAATTSKKGDKSDFEKRLVEFFKYQIESDDSPIYGVGFEKVNQMVLSNGHDLKDTLNDIVTISKTIRNKQTHIQRK